MNSGNSSKPPSSDSPYAKPEDISPKGKHKKKRGAQVGHKGHSRTLMVADAIVRYEPGSCHGCGVQFGSQSEAATDGAVWQVAELPQLSAHVTSHIAAGRTCNCGKVSHGKIPTEVLAHGYGPRMGAFVSLLLVRYGLSRRDVAQFASSVFGVPIATGSVCSLAAELGNSLEAPAAQALAAVQNEPVVHADETGWSIDKKLAWLWVIVGRRATVFLTHAHRNKAAAQALVGEVSDRVVVTDRYAAYNDIPLCKRQLCLAHVLRDTQAMQERGGAAKSLGQQIAAALRKGIHCFNLFRESCIDHAELIRRGKREKARCKRALDHAESLGDELDRKTRGVCKALARTEAALWTFLEVPGVEPTNNAAERAIRPAVIIRKTSFGSDSERGAMYFARVLSAVSSLERQSRDVFTYFQNCLSAARSGTLAPSFIAHLSK